MAAPDVSNIEKMVTALTEKRLAFLRRSPELDGLSHAQASRATARQPWGWERSGWCAPCNQKYPIGAAKLNILTNGATN